MILEKLDCPVRLLLGTSHRLHCNHLWTLLPIALHFIVNGQSFALQPFLILTASPNSEHPLIFAPIACAAALELLLSSGKLDGPIWYSGMSNFPT
jgi:hypothetical protein